MIVVTCRAVNHQLPSSIQEIPTLCQDSRVEMSLGEILNEESAGTDLSYILYVSSIHSLATALKWGNLNV